MAYAVGFQCIDDLGLARDYYFSGVEPRINGQGEVTQYQKHNGSWQLVTTVNGVVTHQTTAVADFPYCSNADRFKDGAELGSGVLIVVAAVWSIMQLKRAF